MKVREADAGGVSGATRSSKQKGHVLSDRIIRPEIIPALTSYSKLPNLLAFTYEPVGQCHDQRTNEKKTNQSHKQQTHFSFLFQFHSLMSEPRRLHRGLPPPLSSVRHVTCFSFCFRVYARRLCFTLVYNCTSTASRLSALWRQNYPQFPILFRINYSRKNRNSATHLNPLQYHAEQ